MSFSDMTQQNFQLRAATRDDLPAVVDLLNNYYRKLVGADQYSVDGMKRNWTRPNFDPTTDSRSVLDADNNLIANIAVWCTSAPYVDAFAGLVVHEDYLDSDIPDELIAWAENRASEIMKQAPEDAMLRIYMDAYDNDEHRMNFLKDHNYQECRRFWTMKIDLVDNEIPEPNFPDYIRMTNLDETDDLKSIALATDEAFSDHWGHVETPEEEILQHWEHWKSDSSFDPNVWFIAMDGEEIAGMSLCKTKMEESENWGYVNTLGVRRNWRRQGIALSLLQYTFRHMKKLGKTAVLLDVDATSLTGADKLYKRAGMYTYRTELVYEKIVRDGKDYVTT